MLRRGLLVTLNSVIHIGTSGYDYSGWVGADRFYPPSLKNQRRDWLTYYASQFDVAELNFTYYGETKPQQMEDMLRRVDPAQALYLLEGEIRPLPQFQFVIKAYSALTHEMDPGWRAVAEKFVNDVAPLQQSRKLAGVLAQFTPKMKYGEKPLTYVVRLAEALAPMQLIAEFRHPSWFTPEVAAQLSRRGIVFTLVDTPPEVKLPLIGLNKALDAEQVTAPLTEASGEEVRAALAPAPFAYVRMHGRNAGHWFGGDGVQRYNWNYTADEMDWIAWRTRTHVPEHLYVLFNNCYWAYAARNAQHLKELYYAQGRE
jgi:uncharacterized protein YecE (DUF72 family)